MPGPSRQRLGSSRSRRRCPDDRQGGLIGRATGRLSGLLGLIGRAGRLSGLLSGLLRDLQRSGRLRPQDWCWLWLHRRATPSPIADAIAASRALYPPQHSCVREAREARIVWLLEQKWLRRHLSVPDAICRKRTPASSFPAGTLPFLREKKEEEDACRSSIFCQKALQSISCWAQTEARNARLVSYMVCLRAWPHRSQKIALSEKLGARGPRYRPGHPETYSLRSELQIHRTKKR